MARLALIILFLALMPACKSLPFFGDDEATSEPVSVDLTEIEGDIQQGKAPASAAIDELELKHARTWRRVDELEEEVTSLKAKLKVLEKGLVLGLMPEELKSKSNEPEMDVPPTLESSTEKAIPAPPAPPEKVLQYDKGLYEKKLAEAQQLYQDGKYGRAIVEYSSLGREFGEKVGDGLHLYWIGRCWGRLKEFQTSRQYFIDFLKEYPQSNLVPRTKLDLARIEMALGLQETALQRFRRIIQDHPYDDAAEMAKMELRSLGRNL